MKRYAVVAILALVVLAIAAPAQARGERDTRDGGYATMDIENVVGFGTVCDGKLLTYVGILEFASGEYEIAFFAPLGPPPAPDFFDTWIQFQGWWVIYEPGSLDLDLSDGLTCPTNDGIRMERDRGVGHFALNEFYGKGPGATWTGIFVDGDGNPAPFHPPTGQFNTRFVGSFWLFERLTN